VEYIARKSLFKHLYCVGFCLFPILHKNLKRKFTTTTYVTDVTLHTLSYDLKQVASEPYTLKGPTLQVIPYIYPKVEIQGDNKVGLG